MFVRYGQAALLAAVMTLTGNAVWAQDSYPQGGFANGYAPPACNQPYGKCCKKTSGCAAGSCCKEEKCCKEGKCCNGGACGACGTSCCKEGNCCKDKAGDKETKCPFCPFMNQLAKHTAIILVMPASMPLLGHCPPEMMGMMPHPPMPPGPHVMMPPPILSPPGIPPHPFAMPLPSQLHVQEANTGNLIYGYGVNSNCGVCGSITPIGITPIGSPTGTVAPCIATATAAYGKGQIIATTCSDQLEMNIGEDTSIRCKKMTVKIGENVIALSIFDGKIRIRGEDLKATADSVRSNGKDRIVLEGDVDLHYKNKESHFASVIRAGRIVLNLSSGTVSASQIETLDSQAGSYTGN